MTVGTRATHSRGLVAWDPESLRRDYNIPAGPAPP